jgi:hypothetical protein
MLNQAVRLLRRGGLLLVHEFCSTLEGDRIEALVPSVLTVSVDSKVELMLVHAAFHECASE